MNKGTPNSYNANSIIYANECMGCINQQLLKLIS
jgi:hypothetical protein